MNRGAAVVGWPLLPEKALRNSATMRFWLYRATTHGFAELQHRWLASSCSCATRERICPSSPVSAFSWVAASISQRGRGTTLVRRLHFVIKMGLPRGLRGDSDAVAACCRILLAAAPSWLRCARLRLRRVAARVRPGLAWISLRDWRIWGFCLLQFARVAGRRPPRHGERERFHGVHEMLRLLGAPAVPVVRFVA